MPAISRRSIRAAISKTAVLATADDLNGTSDNTQAFDVTSGDRLIIAQLNSGTAGTAGIDVVEYSDDGGKTWSAATDLLAIGSDDATGSVVTGGILNAAGVEPSGAAIWKAGPFEGPHAVRVTRNVSTNATSAAWVTGAPAVVCVLVGGTTGDLTALA
jgi:hypothetical protein